MIVRRRRGMRGGGGGCDCSCCIGIGYAGGVWVDRNSVVYTFSFPNGHTRVANRGTKM